MAQGGKGMLLQSLTTEFRDIVIAHFHPRHRVAPRLDNKDRVLSAVNLFAYRGYYNGVGRRGERLEWLIGYDRASLIDKGNAPLRR